MSMSRREALFTLLREKRYLGYVPFSTYGIDRYSHPWMAEDPSYREVLEYTDRYDHIQVLYLSYYSSFGLTDILQVEDSDRVETKVYREGDAEFYHHTLHTPKGDLTAEQRRIDGNMSIWHNSNLIKEDKDIDAFLAMPFVPAVPDMEAYQSVRRELGDAGLIQIQVPTPVAMAVENMDYNDFLVRTATMPNKLFELLEKTQTLIMTWLQGIVDAGMCESVRMFGPELATPPLTPPEFYRRAVTEMDRPIVNMVQEGGGFVQYHCHGAIGRIFDQFLELGVDATDPCEAPPSGDITLRELAERAEGELVLMGNIQLDDLERSTETEIDRLVKEAVEQVGDRAPFLLVPTAPPFESPLPPQVARNIIQFIESARSV